VSEPQDDISNEYQPSEPQPSAPPSSDDSIENWIRESESNIQEGRYDNNAEVISSGRYGQ